jgi:hypothetical protein
VNLCHPAGNHFGVGTFRRVQPGIGQDADDNRGAVQ